MKKKFQKSETTGHSKNQIIAQHNPFFICMKFHQNAEQIGSVTPTKVFFFLITMFSQKMGFWIKFFNFKAQSLSNTNNIKNKFIVLLVL